jgi:hypothetical protein
VGEIAGVDVAGTSVMVDVATGGSTRVGAVVGVVLLQAENANSKRIKNKKCSLCKIYFILWGNEILARLIL